MNFRPGQRYICTKAIADYFSEGSVYKADAQGQLTNNQGMQVSFDLLTDLFQWFKPAARLSDAELLEKKGGNL